MENYAGQLKFAEKSGLQQLYLAALGLKLGFKKCILWVPLKDYVSISNKWLDASSELLYQMHMLLNTLVKKTLPVTLWFFCYMLDDLSFKNVRFSWNYVKITII